MPPRHDDLFEDGQLPLETAPSRRGLQNGRLKPKGDGGAADNEASPNLSLATKFAIVREARLVGGLHAARHWMTALGLDRPPPGPRPSERKARQADAALIEQVRIFLDERCTQDRFGSIQSSTLMAAFKEWFLANTNDPPGSMALVPVPSHVMFAYALRALKIPKHAGGGRVHYRGLCWKDVG